MDFLTRDGSGNGNDATPSNVALTTGPEGKSSRAYEFRGASDSFLSISNNGKLDVRTAVTIAMYVYVTASSNGPVLQWTFSSGTNSDYGVHAWVQTNGVFMVRFNGRGAVAKTPLSFTGLKLDAWNFVAASYSKATGEAKIYHNETTVATASIGSHDLETSGALRVGVSGKTSDTQFFTGKISCIQIYDEVLSRDDVFVLAKERCEPGMH